MRQPLLKPVTLVAAILTGLQSACRIFYLFRELNTVLDSEYLTITDWLTESLIPTLAWVCISLFFFILYFKQKKL